MHFLLIVRETAAHGRRTWRIVNVGTDVQYWVGYISIYIHTDYVELPRNRLAIAVCDGQHLPWQVMHLWSTYRRPTAAHIPHTFMPIILVT